MASLAILLFAASMGLVSVAAAQTQKTGSIRGMVRVLDGLPATGAVSVSVAMDGNRKTVEADEEGRYSFSELEPGEYSLTVVRRIPNGLSSAQGRRITVGSGDDLFGINFVFAARGEISGKVLDARQEPVRDCWVYLLTREYQQGMLRYSYANYAVTDAKGAYVFRSVGAGRSYLVLAERRDRKLDAKSEPADPELRKKVLAPTFFPGTEVVEAAQPIVLRAGEHRSGVDITFIESPQFCIEGELKSELEIRRVELIPGSLPMALMGSTTVQVIAQGIRVKPDRKVRICGLHRGDHQVRVFSKYDRSPGEESASTTISITDRDVPGVLVPVRSRAALLLDATWSGVPPDPPVSVQLTVGLTSFAGGFNRRYPLSIPGEFRIEDLELGDYRVVVDPPEEAYVKDIFYGGMSIMGLPLRFGTEPGNAGLRIVLGRDGGTLRIRVANDDGKPIGDSSVLVIPAGTGSDAALAAAMIMNRTDQNGDYTSSRLAPGKYLVLATMGFPDASPESISRIVRSLSRAKVVELAPNGSVQITVQPTTIE